MEKIKLSNGTEFNLIPMGIEEKEKSRTFIIKTDDAYSNIETAFSDVSNIKYLSEAGELLKFYLDGVSLKTISRDYENGTYAIEVSTDVMVAEIKSLKEMIIELQSKSED